jgi:restriction endonuclease Mrr
MAPSEQKAWKHASAVVLRWGQAQMDGRKFAEMMIRYNVGVRVKESYQIKRIDLDYFRKGPGGDGALQPAASP